MNNARKIDAVQAAAWMRAKGVRDVDAVLKGVDRRQPMTIEWLDPGDELVQYVDLPSFQFPDGGAGGRWFALPSHDARDLATLGTGSGAAGRRRAEFVVARVAEVFVSTAVKIGLSSKLYERTRGRGGATQLFLPDGGRSCLVGKGASL